jgi:bifunctional DNA-binding transcriptional regulator/antitoxin component of YhaV-PrlF toxin-antitoxin module
MNRVLVEKGFRLTLPKELRDDLQEGEEFIVTVDSAGRIVLLSEKPSAPRYNARLASGRVAPMYRRME